MASISSRAAGGGATRLGLARPTALVAATIALWLVALGAVLAPASGHAAPTYPAFSAPVVDAAHVLSDADKAALTRKVIDLQDKTGVQFAVATVPSLDGEEIEPYANGLFRDWKIGQKGANNGLLLVLAPKERKLRFEVGYGLEGAFTDLQSKLILRNTMVPKLKAGDPAGALKAGVDDAIIVLTKSKEDLPQRLRANKDQPGNVVLGFVILFVFFLIFVAIIVLSFRRGRRSSSWGPAAAGGFVGSSASDFGSSSDSSSGSDSFSGGGGGDSGGGGSSDSY